MPGSIAVSPRRVTLTEVQAAAGELREIGKQLGIRNIRVFGSVARGEATVSSDLDLLVDVDEGIGLFALSEFALAAEELLRVPTQVVTRSGLRASGRAAVLREAVSV